jgi:hypothetical protein
MFFNLDLTFVSLGKNKGSIGFAAARLRVFSGKSLSEIKAKTPRRVNQVYSDSEEADSDHDGQNEESTQEWFIKDTLEKGKVPVPWSKNLIQVNQIKSNPLFEKPQPGETKFNGLWKPEMSVPVATFCKLAGFAQMCKDGFLTEFPFNAHMLLGPCNVCASLNHATCVGALQEAKLISFKKGFSDMFSKLNNDSFNGKVKDSYSTKMPVSNPPQRGGRGGRGRGWGRGRGRGRGGGQPPSSKARQPNSPSAESAGKSNDAEVNAFLSMSTNESANVSNVSAPSLSEDLNKLSAHKFDRTYPTSRILIVVTWIPMQKKTKTLVKSTRFLVSAQSLVLL